MKQIESALMNTIRIASLFGLMSYIREINLESSRLDPTLVVNCVTITGEPLTVSVSHTWFFMDDYPDVILDRAEVNLFVNGVFKKRMSFQERDEAFSTEGYFKSDFTPVKGDRIRVEASYPEYGVASVEAAMPAPARVLKTGATYATVADSFDSHQNAIYQVTPKDNLAKENYYLLRMEEGIPVFDGIAKEYIGEYKWFLVSPSRTTKPILGQSLTALDQIFGNNWMYGYDEKIFSDELINERGYTLHLAGEYYYESYYGSYPPKVVPDSMGMEDLDEKDFPPIPPKHLRVHLYAISAEYYRYLKVLQDKDTDSVPNLLIDDSLAKPIRIFSSIDDGVDIPGSCHVGMSETEIASSSHSNLRAARFEDRID